MHTWAWLPLGNALTLHFCVMRWRESCHCAVLWDRLKEPLSSCRRGDSCVGDWLLVDCSHFRQGPPASVLYYIPPILFITPHGCSSSKGEETVLLGLGRRFRSHPRGCGGHLPPAHPLSAGRVANSGELFLTEPHSMKNKPLPSHTMLTSLAFHFSCSDS